VSPIPAICPADLFLLYFTARIIFDDKSRSPSSLGSLFHFPVTPSLLDWMSSSAPYCRTALAYISLSVWEAKCHTYTKQQQNYTEWF
jgi:hypothetical protein